MREWLRQRLTPLGRYDRRCAREYDAMLKRHETRAREAYRSGELQRRSPKRMIQLPGGAK